MTLIFEFLCIVISFTILGLTSLALLSTKLNLKPWRTSIVLIPLVLGIATWVSLTFFTFRFSLGNYDESRVPLEYPFEIIDGEFGCYLVDNSTHSRINLVSLHNRQISIVDDGLQFRNISSDSVCYIFTYADSFVKESNCGNSDFTTVNSLLERWYIRRVIIIALICVFQFLLSVGLILYLGRQKAGVTQYNELVSKRP